MTRPPVYLDGSALARLVWREPESDDLADWLSAYPHWLSSMVVRVEMLRAAGHAGEPAGMRERAERYLERLTLVHVDAGVIELAAALPGRDLHPLAAIHLATALSLGDLPDAFLTYDARLAAAAKRQGLTVVHPGVNVPKG